MSESTPSLKIKLRLSSPAAMRSLRQRQSVSYKEPGANNFDDRSASPPPARHSRNTRRNASYAEDDYYDDSFAHDNSFTNGSRRSSSRQPKAVNFNEQDDVLEYDDYNDYVDDDASKRPSKSKGKAKAQPQDDQMLVPATDEPDLDSADPIAIGAGDVSLDQHTFEQQEEKHGVEPEQNGEDEVKGYTRSGRPVKSHVQAIFDSEDEDEILPSKKRRKEPSDDDSLQLSSSNEEDYDDTQRRQNKLQRLVRSRSESRYPTRSSAMTRKTSGRQTRNSRSAALDDPNFIAHTTSEDDDLLDEDDFSRSYKLRHRSQKVDYRLPTLEQIANDDLTGATRSRKEKKKRKFGGSKRLPFSMSGRQLGALFGNNQPDSSDDDFNTPRKGMFAGAGGSMFAGSMNMDLASGTPSNLGKVSGTTNLADTDPLLPQTTLTFDSVGGLEQEIQQLKEMVSLPLLYPEVFQKFGITPPRGVLFHGPPGTGKTLLARTLAASCSTEGQKISFFMRKGADCLSKWVGEAERQLRLLFEEAKACQPSIIFFDEIDGLAPVRSSKQDQIHASIVSTLLALMDGMDGRGQVIVIGATNRPDAIDPALRRPGRFDREFYFPLPNFNARRKIIEINTKLWQPPLEALFLDELAEMTKGYGGADLRALCTEAALNAVQRRYPQIYRTSDRLLIKPEEIEVTARDFILASQNLIPSTARSTSSLAAPLPDHLQPLLQNTLETAKASLSKVLPEIKKHNLLEEAEYESPANTEAGFVHERMMQRFESLRVYRPRLMIAGAPGMGQSYVGAAVLQHLEGYHVQSLDLGMLVSDSARTQEAAVVQIFTEAKRHKPSILYIPSLLAWCASVGEQVKMTVKSLLDGLDASDPVLLLAIVESEIEDVPRDVRSWFGLGKIGRVVVEKPLQTQRQQFFANIIESIKKPPTSYPDGQARKRRILEVLPKAPPPKPRELTATELEAQKMNDYRLQEMLKFRLGPVLSEIKKRYKKFNDQIGEGEVEVPVEDEAPITIPDDETETNTKPNGNDTAPTVNGHTDTDPTENADQDDKPQPEVNGIHDEDKEMDDAEAEDKQPEAEGDQEPVKPVQKTRTMRFHDMDLDTVHHNLYYNVYLTPDDMLHDMSKIVQNAYMDGDPELSTRADQMLNQARVAIDQACDEQFRMECERMARRERARRKEEKERRQAEKEKAKELAEAPKMLTRTNSQLGDTVIEDPVAIERRLKRARSDTHLDVPGAANGGSGSEDEGANKRPRLSPASETSEAAVLATDGNFEAGMPGNVIMEGVEGADHRYANIPGGQTTPTKQTAPALDVIPSTSPDIATKAHQDLENHFVHAQQDAEPMQKSPTPELLPDLTFSAESLSAIEFYLGYETASLNIEQMEQLRAGCYDVIWRARKEWDKNGLISEIDEFARELVAEVAELYAQDE